MTLRNNTVVKVRMNKRQKAVVEQYAYQNGFDQVSPFLRWMLSQQIPEFTTPKKYFKEVNHE